MSLSLAKNWWIRILAVVAGAVVVAAYVPLPEDSAALESNPPEGLQIASFVPPEPSVVTSKVGGGVTLEPGAGVIAPLVSQPEPLSEFNWPAEEPFSELMSVLPPESGLDGAAPEPVDPETLKESTEIEEDIPMARPYEAQVIHLPPLTRASRVSSAAKREKIKPVVSVNFEEAIASARRAIRRAGLKSRATRKIAVIDFSKPSYLKRMGIFSMGTLDGEPVSRHLVAHGMNSGATVASRFSNSRGSHMSSPGLYRVGESYRGKHGTSLRLHGLERGLNDKALERDIVLHSADYVSYGTIVQNIMEKEGPRIGRSQGCPAVPKADMKHLAEHLTPGSLIYIFVRGR